MELTLTDAIALTFMSVLLVLGASSVRQAWSEPGASRFVANLRRGLPYLGDREVRALCRAMPCVVVATAGLLTAVASGFVAAGTDESLLKALGVLAILLATATSVVAGILAIGAAAVGRPRAVIPPPFRDHDDLT